MFNWSNEEVVITVYFSSRCIRPKSLCCLLLRRGHIRSLSAVERKIISITKQHPYLKSSNGHWDLNAIDRWMNDLIRSHESVNKLIKFSLEDAEDMALVSCPFGVFFTSTYRLLLIIETICRLSIGSNGKPRSRFHRPGIQHLQGFRNVSLRGLILDSTDNRSIH